jgi:hypothetical protein
MERFSSEIGPSWLPCAHCEWTTSVASIVLSRDYWTWSFHTLSQSLELCFQFYRQLSALLFSNHYQHIQPPAPIIILNLTNQNEGVFYRMSLSKLNYGLLRIWRHFYAFTVHVVYISLRISRGELWRRENDGRIGADRNSLHLSHVLIPSVSVDA